MGSMYGAMSIAVRALLAEQGAMDVTANNLANVNTPGYARQRPVFEEGPPLLVGSLALGSGVNFAQPQGVRNAILELRMHEETQQQGQYDAMVEQLKQVEVNFQSGSGDIGTQLSNFFNSLNDLAAQPSSLSLRQAVLTAADNVARTFRNVAHNLQLQRSNLDLSVTQSVNQVNQLTKQVADLNAQVAALENLHQDASVFIDQRTQRIRELSQLIDVRVIDNGNTLSLTTANGTALVADSKSFSLQTQLDASGSQHVYALGQDITSQLTSGKLGGLIAVRDQKIPGVLSQLDALAAGLSTALNTAHQNGFDLNGSPGTSLFTAPPAGWSGAAAAIALAIQDPSLLAASSDGSPGSNGNLTALGAVRNQNIVSGQNPFDFYSSIVFNVGNDASTASAESEASGLILRQLEDQRGALSGVSLDEEAANLIRFQRAYEAAARVVTVISDMTETAVNLGKD